MGKKLILSVAVIASFSLWWLFISPSKSTLPIVGMIQAAEHPALDQTRKGIVDELASQGFIDGKTITLSYESAQGNSALATQIAQKFIGQKVAIIVTIGTTVSQAALQVIKQSGGNTPLVFASVTNPMTSKLVASDKVPEKGVSGVSNYVLADKQFHYFKKLLPNLKRLGVVYNPGEANSVVLNGEMVKASKDAGIEIVFATANKTSEVSAATQSLLDKVDAIFINNDNTVLASFDSVVVSAAMHNIPVFVSDLDCLKRGALAAFGADQYELGHQVGSMVADVLKQPGVEFSKTMTYAEKVQGEINQKVAMQMNLKLPA